MPINRAINMITLISNEMYIYLFILNCDINFMNFSYQSHCWVQIFLKCTKILSQHHFFLSSLFSPFLSCKDVNDYDKILNYNNLKYDPFLKIDNF